MVMTVKKTKDSRTKEYIMHRIADVRGGVSVATSELGGDYLAESTPLYFSGGKWHALKIARVAEKTTSTSVKVQKTHNLKVGDVLLMTVGEKAASVSKIDTSAKGYDIITLSAALGTINAGAVLVEAAEAQTTSGAALKHAVDALVGTGKPIEPNSNVITDAWLIGVINDVNFPDAALPKGFVKSHA